MRAIIRQIRIGAIVALICWLSVVAGCTSPAGASPSPSDGPMSSAPSPSDGPVSPAPSLGVPYRY